MSDGQLHSRTCECNNCYSRNMLNEQIYRCGKENLRMSGCHAPEKPGQKALDAIIKTSDSLIEKYKEIVREHMCREDRMQEEQNASPMVKQMQELERKIENLQKDFIRLNHFGLPQYEHACKELEKRINNDSTMFIQQINKLERRIEKLEKENNHLNKIIRDSIGGICAMPSRKAPHTCPNCEGSPKVLTEIAKHDFDGAMRAGLELSKKCHSCEGKGIVWG